MSAFDTLAAHDYDSLLSGTTTDYELGGSCRTRFDLDGIEHLSSLLKSAHAGNGVSQEADLALTVDLARRLAIELRIWSKEIRELRDEPASRMVQILQDVSTITCGRFRTRIHDSNAVVARHCARRSDTGALQQTRIRLCQVPVQEGRCGLHSASGLTGKHLIRARFPISGGSYLPPVLQCFAIPPFSSSCSLSSREACGKQ
jgi:hypothetical protein